jgi:hypothetical protein
MPRLVEGSNHYGVRVLTLAGPPVNAIDLDLVRELAQGRDAAPTRRNRRARRRPDVARVVLTALARLGGCYSPGAGVAIS